MEWKYILMICLSAMVFGNCVAKKWKLLDVKNPECLKCLNKMASQKKIDGFGNSNRIRPIPHLMVRLGSMKDLLPSCKACTELLPKKEKMNHPNAITNRFKYSKFAHNYLYRHQNVPSHVTPQNIATTPMDNGANDNVQNTSGCDGDDCEDNSESNEDGIPIEQDTIAPVATPAPDLVTGAPVPDASSAPTPDAPPAPAPEASPDALPTPDALLAPTPAPGEPPAPAPDASPVPASTPGEPPAPAPDASPAPAPTPGEPPAPAPDASPAPAPTPGEPPAPAPAPGASLAPGPGTIPLPEKKSALVTEPPGITEEAKTTLSVLDEVLNLLKSTPENP